MAILNNIFQRVRDAFLSESAKAPVDLWDSIASGLDQSEMNVDQKVHEAFDSVQHTAPDLWSQIERQMAIDTTWAGIAKSQDRRRRRKIALWIVPLAVLIIGILYWVPKMDANKEQLSPLSQKNNASQQQPARHQEVSPSDQTTTVTENDQELPVLAGEEAIRPVELLPSATVDVPEVTVDLDAAPLAEIPQNVFMNLQSRRAYIRWNGQDMDFPVVSAVRPHEATVFKGTNKWRFGVVGCVNNSVVNNNISREGERVGSIIETEFTINLCAGAELSYRLNNRDQIQTQININQVNRQNFKEFDNGEYLSKSNLFLYDKLFLTYQKRLFAVRAQEAFFRVGGYGARLKTARELIDGELIDITDQYRAIDLGLTLGLSYQKNWGHWGTTIGLNSDLGLVNVFKGDHVRPSAFDQTRQRVYYLSAALNYRL